MAALDDLRLDGRVALVTGGASPRGLGRAIAVRLASAGAQLVVGDLDEAGARETAALCEAEGPPALALRMDVTDEASVNVAYAAAVERFGAVDVLVNNAGIVRQGQLGTTTSKEWDEAVGINLRGAFLLTNAVFPLMRERKRGVIVNVASIAGQTGGTLASVNYTASKGGLISLTKATAKQMAPWGRANSVTPGQILTRMGTMTAADLDAVAAHTPLGRIGEAPEVAHAILFLASPASSFITGHTLNVNGGILMD